MLGSYLSQRSTGCQLEGDPGVVSPQADNSEAGPKTTGSAMESGSIGNDGEKDFKKLTRSRKWRAQWRWINSDKTDGAGAVVEDEKDAAAHRLAADEVARATEVER